MLDFYISQKVSKPLTASQAQTWYLTVKMLGPDSIIMGDDETDSIMLGTKDGEYVYILPLARHLTAQEAEKIIQGYLSVTDHDFEIETSSVYQIQPDWGHPFDYDISMDQPSREFIANNLARHHHNLWIQTRIDQGWRYGLTLDLQNKTHPAIRPWDDLPESYRKSQLSDNKTLVDYYVKNSSLFN